jgi:xanthine dehydrogenase YagT iron-sulfur-binding subunit
MSQHETSPPIAGSRTERGGGFNRRDFLRGSGAAMAATALATAHAERAEAAQAQAAKVVPAEGADLTLNVNGKDVTVKQVEPRITLLELLRNELNLTGAKHADDTTATGCDTVMIDGKAALASAVFAHECAGKKVRTVESLRSEQEIDAVVSGFVKHDGMQCGFCTPGFVMATRAFLDKNPRADLATIQKGLGGNLCRCGTYQGITQCALELAKGGA